MAEYKDRVKDQTNTTGTGTITVDGVAGSGGYRTIAAAHTNGATLRYTIINSTGSEWEVGEGVWTSSTSTLTRATVYASSNAGGLVNFSAGAKVVFTGPVARDLTEALPTSGGTLTGTVTFGSSLRILGDFSNLTVASRPIFQTNTTNGSTFLTAMPNGTGTATQFQAYNSSDPANASVGSLGVTSNQVRIVSTNTGTGSLNPITFLFGTTEVARFTTSGDLLIGTTTDDGVNLLQVAGGTALSGNLNLSGTARRITGDFSNATVASRTLFQTSTTNGQTFVTAIPNGTAVNSQFQAYNSSDPANASVASLVAANATVRLVSGNTGTGTLLPIAFIMSATEVARFTTGGNLLINTTTDDGTNKLQVNGGVAISGNVALHAGNYSTYAYPKAGGQLDGNIGMGIGSPAWQTGYRSIDYSGGSLASSYSGHIRLYQNAFNNSGGTFTYRNTAAATLYDQDSGTHTWYTAPSGTGGTTISFTAQMTLSNAGALNVLGAITQNSNQVVHAGNVSTYALPIGGGTLTGQVTSRITDTGRVFESQNSSASNAAQFTVTHSAANVTVRNERGVLALSGSGGVTIGGFTPVTSNNYLDYVPTTMNAYGTWPTANSQNMNTNQTNGWYDIVWGNYTGSINTPSAPNSYGNLLVFGGNTFKTQIFVPNSADSSPFVRSFYNNTWTSWVTTLTSANYTNYPVTGPTVRVARSANYTVTGSVWSKVQFNSETWDTANNFDSTTNYRFTPTKAGYYSVTVNVSGPNQCIASIYKNGSEYATSGWSSGGAFMGVTDLVYFNGSTDYVEGYVWTDGTTIYGGPGTNFSAFWIQP